MTTRKELSTLQRHLRPQGAQWHAVKSGVKRMYAQETKAAVAQRDIEEAANKLGLPAPEVVALPFGMRPCSRSRGVSRHRTTSQHTSPTLESSIEDGQLKNSTPRCQTSFTPRAMVWKLSLDSTNVTQEATKRRSFGALRRIDGDDDLGGASAGHDVSSGQPRQSRRAAEPHRCVTAEGSRARRRRHGTRPSVRRMSYASAQRTPHSSHLAAERSS